MTALWCITGLSVALACTALVLLAKVRDDLTAAYDVLAEVRASRRAHGEARFRDGFAAGVDTAAAVRDAGIELLRTWDR